MLPSGLVTLLKASAEPLETKVAADVQLFPGRRIICEVALEKQVGFRISQFLRRQNHDIPGLSDSGNSSLNGLSPSDNIWDIVWLVHSKYIELEVNWDRIRN